MKLLGACFPVLATDYDSRIAVETFGNYLSLILASEVPFAPFILLVVEPSQQ